MVHTYIVPTTQIHITRCQEYTIKINSFFHSFMHCKYIYTSIHPSIHPRFLSIFTNTTYTHRNPELKIRHAIHSILALNYAVVDNANLRVAFRSHTCIHNATSSQWKVFARHLETGRRPKASPLHRLHRPSPSPPHRSAKRCRSDPRWCRCVYICMYVCM